MMAVLPAMCAGRRLFSFGLQVPTGRECPPMKPTMRGMTGFAALLAAAALAGCFEDSTVEVAATAATTATGAPAVWRWRRTAAGGLRVRVEPAFTIESDR